MQVPKKLIPANAIDHEKIRLGNDYALRGRNNANTADISIIKVNSSDLPEFGAKPQSSFTPSEANDLVNLSYLQDYMVGMRDPKDAVRAASTGNVVIATGTLLTIDDIELAAGDRVLLKNQTDPKENGIYIAAVGAWSRSGDANSSAEVTQGMSVDVVEGTANGRSRWLLTTADVVLGTTNLTFVEVPVGVVVPVQGQQILTFAAGDITSQYKDLADLVNHNSVMAFFYGVKQVKDVDFTLSDVGGVTRVTLAGDLATGGACAMVSGESLDIHFEK